MFNSLNIESCKYKKSIHNNTKRLEKCMFQLGVYKSNERFSWDRLKENEEEYKTLQMSFTKLNRKYLEMSKKVVY
jgi:hypothetical protein